MPELRRTARILVFLSLAASANAQTFQRRATVTGGGDRDRGKCTVEVVVDGAAEVEIRGDSAILRNLAGQPPQWRRFECTSTMPANPPNFRFIGVDGRGSQELVRGPRNGGVAVVRIQDPASGSEGYTFDIVWGGQDRQQYSGGGSPYPAPPVPGGFGRDERLGFPAAGRRATAEQAVRICQDAVSRQAAERFHSDNISFRRIVPDDQPGGQDSVRGIFDLRRGYDRDEAYRFSCSVDFEAGIVRSAEIQPLDRDRDERRPEIASEPSRVALDSCSRAVENRIREQGYQHVDFLSINTDDRPGRNDWILGMARADIRFRSDTFTFSCSVDLRDGDVRSVDVRRR